MTMASVVGGTEANQNQPENMIQQLESLDVRSAVLIPGTGRRVFSPRKTTAQGGFEIFEMTTQGTHGGWNHQVILEILLPSIFTLLTLLCLTHLVMLVISSNPAPTRPGVISVFNP
ncbi:MAG: hypothetical protein AB7P76_02165 [Candidatus Melainabacteria bacterium]